MKTKRTYLAANIRAGYTADHAARMAKVAGATGPFFVDVDTFQHGYDTNGNGTAHYRCTLMGINEKTGKECAVLHIVESGKRREQVGYGRGNDAALYALEKLGYEVDTSKASSDDYRGCAVYPLLNFPPKVEA